MFFFHVPAPVLIATEVRKHPFNFEIRDVIRGCWVWGNKDFGVKCTFNVLDTDTFLYGLKEKHMFVFSSFMPGTVSAELDAGVLGQYLTVKTYV